MKKIILILSLFMVFIAEAPADFLGVYDNGNDSADDSVWVYFTMWDSLALKFESPDTMFVFCFGPVGDTVTADTITSPDSLNYSNGYYMKRYRAGLNTGQYTVHAYGSGNGNYYSLADHNYYVNGEPINKLSAADIGDIADSCRQLVWRTVLVPGFPTNGDTISAIIYQIREYVDGNGAGGIDYDIENLNDIDSAGVYYALLSALMADSALVDTGNGSYASATVKSGSIPDSLLEAVTSIDSIQAWLGSPYQQSQIPTLHMKVGLGYSGLDGVGNNIRDDLAALTSMGGGSEPETLVVLSASDSSKIQGARIGIRTVDQSTVKVSGLITDLNGCLILALDPDSFWVEINANGFNPVMDTIVVADGGGSESYYLSMFNPGNPPEPGLCRVYGWVYNISADSLPGIAVTAEIPREYHPVKYGNIVITPFSTSTITDSSGYWQLDLIPGEALSGDNVKYMFTVKSSSGVIYRAKVEVPQLASWQLQ